ncbi:MAG: radical SAM protein [Spirochaetaceae bacterium]|nr:radical SAM protein [Spirochaetaceae bacterium]
MFRPEEIIFAPTARCNLRCAHCRVTRVPDELDAASAIAFMEDCAARGVERVGFSGGEPFLRPDFLREVSSAAVGLGLLFDRLMTNGVWWRDEAELTEVLGGLADAGFDGKLGLSVDAYHDSEAEALGAFVLAAFGAFGRRDCVEILSVESADDAPLLEKLRRLAAVAGGGLILEDGRPAAIAEAPPRRGAPPRPDGEELRIDIRRFPYSAAAEEDAWRSESWFEDDWCAGPGNVFYVHPNGKVAVCCGFANENEELVVGRLSEGCEALLASAARSPRVRACYETGLGERRKALEASGTIFPGKTSDLCFFCDYLCKKGL